MKTKEFNKLLEKHKANPQELIRMHCNLKIYLTSSQFDKVVRVRDGKRLKYEESVDNSDNVSSIRRVWDRIKKALRVETLQERIRLYLTRRR